MLLSTVGGSWEFLMVGLSKRKNKVQPVTCHEDTEAE